MSEWLELHYAVFDHPKTKRMARMLKTPPAAVVGHLASLWAFTAQYAKDGDLTDMEDEEIEVGAGWEGVDGAFLKAAITVGFLDAGSGSTVGHGSNELRVKIHDWNDYAGKWANRRKRNAERMRSLRALHVQGEDGSRDTTCDARASNVRKCAELEDRQTDKTEESAREKLADPTVDPSIAALVAKARGMGEEWKHRDDDEFFFNVLLEKFPASQVSSVIDNLIIEQAARDNGKRYVDLRRTLGNWMKREVPSVGSNSSERLRYYDITMSPPAWRWSDDDSLVGA